MHEKDFDVVILGAGPAGLAAANALTDSGNTVALVDRGNAIGQRDKNCEAELTEGHGGAGLFSDGKFSFYPSATALWKLPNQDQLKDAYTWTCNLLSQYGLDTPPFPDRPNSYSFGNGNWVLKEYPSNYLDLEKRIRMVHSLVDNCDSTILENTYIKDYDYFKSNREFIFTCCNAGQEYKIKSKALILATGRFGPFSLGRTVSLDFKRLEVGFRIQQPNSKSFFSAMSQLDPKLSFRSETQTYEWRTFCACRNGSTVLTRTSGLWTVSGHSDGPDTGISNVGFNTRILSEGIARNSIENLLNSLRNKDNHFKVLLSDALNPLTDSHHQLEKIYGSDLFEAMKQGLFHLINEFPMIKQVDTELVGPALEGVGWYPSLNTDLRMNNSPTWVVGDACGLFRGIVAAFISGHYAATSLNSQMNKLREAA